MIIEIINSLSLPGKFLLNYKGRGRLYYLREMIRPLVWELVRLKNAERGHLEVQRNGFTWFLPLADREIASHIFVHGDFNKRQIEQLAEFLKDQERFQRIIKGDKILLDIGANYGSASLFFARMGLFGEIHAIEPEPENFEILRKTVQANGLSESIRLHPFALSDKSGLIDFGLSAKNKGDHRVLPDRIGPSSAKSGKDRPGFIQVPCKTLDCFFIENDIKPERVGLIWIDVQGHEGHILPVSEILRENPIPVYTEVWPFRLLQYGGLEAFMDFIRRNYRFFIEFDSRRPQPRPVSDIDVFIKKLGTGGRSSDIFIYP